MLHLKTAKKNELSLMQTEDRKIRVEINGRKENNREN